MGDSSESKGPFSEEEREAIAARAAEVRATQGLKGKAKRERQAEEAAKVISEMPGEDRAIAEVIDVVVADVAPQLAPRTWYGMPAYSQGDKVLFFYQAASKFDTRYGSLGFSDEARLDEGEMWATSFAITGITDEVVQNIRDLILRAVGSESA